MLVLQWSVRFYCDISYDPFRFLAQHNKVYGFVITIVESVNTIPTLFRTVKDYVLREGIRPNRGLWDFLTRKDSGGQEEYSEPDAIWLKPPGGLN